MRFFCVTQHFSEYTECFFIVRKEDTKQKDRNRNGYDFFGCKRNPKKCEVATAECLHPSDFEKNAECENDVAPAVCNHPSDQEAEQEAGVQKNSNQLLTPCLDFFFCKIFQSAHTAILLSQIFQYHYTTAEIRLSMKNFCFLLFFDKMRIIVVKSDGEH